MRATITRTLPFVHKMLVSRRCNGIFLLAIVLSSCNSIIGHLNSTVQSCIRSCRLVTLAQSCTHRPSAQVVPSVPVVPAPCLSSPSGLTSPALSVSLLLKPLVLTS